MNIAKAAAVSLTFSWALPAHADELIGEYRTYISDKDLHNSKGDRLTQPWQIIRQDRANFHEFGRADPEDQFDNFFGDIENRKNAESMIRRGKINPSAARSIVRGDVIVRVRIYGHGNTGTSLWVVVE